MDEFQENKISVIVLLAEEQEILKRTGRDLKTLYLRGGLEVIHLPIPDFDVPKSHYGLTLKQMESLGLHEHALLNGIPDPVSLQLKV